MEATYLDASALVKLALRERESDALAAELRGRGRWVSSVVAGVEVPLAARRSGSEEASSRAREALSAVAFIALDSEVVASAAQQEGVRALDAIHLASALLLGEELGAFVSYDKRLNGVAGEAGLPVLSPA